MTSGKFITPLVLAILPLVIVGCSQEKVTESLPAMPVATAEIQNNIEVTEETVTDIVPSPTSPPPTSTSAATDTPELAQVDNESSETTDFCLDCHTDKQTLIDTAKPEEEIVSENEGEG